MYAEKYLMELLWNPWNVLTRMRRRRRRKKERRKRQFLYIGGRDDLIATNTILLNIKHKFYGFSGDLIETIN